MVTRFLRKPAVLAAMGWSHATLYKEIADGRFPKPVKPSPGVAAWPENEVAEAQKRIIAARDAEQIAA